MKLLLAPIQGMTTAHFRNTYAHIFGGIDTYCAPFIATTGKHQLSPKLFKDILPENNDTSLTILPQLLGNSGTDFNNYAQEIVALGYDKINWNIGCPYSMVTKKKKGSGLLAYPTMIKDFLDVVCLDLNYELTVKMRLGFEHLDEGIKVINLLNDYPIHNVTIHARTGNQLYTGYADLNAFEQLAQRSKHTLTYNGDINTPSDFNNLQTRFPSIDSVMIGRGALYNPFLPSEIKGIFLSKSEKLIQLKAFHEIIYTYYKHILSGDQHLCDKMKEFWTYFLVNLDPTDKSIKKIKKCRSIKDYMLIVNDLFENGVH